MNHIRRKEELPNCPALYETQVQSLGQEDPLRRAWLPTPVFFSGKFHGQRILLGYSPWDHKESNTTEQLTHTQEERRAKLMDSNIDKFAHIIGKQMGKSLNNCIYMVEHNATSLAKLRLDW